jgi:uncharacterized membrane protein
VKLATRTLEPAMAMVLSYLAAVLVAFGYIVASGGVSSVTAVGTGYAVLGGIAASGGAVAFYIAVARGQTAIVTPISGLYFVVAAVLGALLLGESIHLRQVAGILCAVVAVVLLGS